MSKQFTLGKSERLKSRKQIEQLFKEGKTISVSPFYVYYSLAPPPPSEGPFGHSSRLTAQFGVGVSAKNFKKAVERNRIKRLIREAYRLQNSNLKEAVKTNNQLLNVFFVYTSKELPDYKFIYDKVAIALQKISREIERQSAK